MKVSSEVSNWRKTFHSIFFSLRTTQSYWEKDVSQIFGVLKRFLGALNLCRALGSTLSKENCMGLT